MRPERTLEDWLHWQTQCHPAAIDLGLERVREVGSRLGLDAPRVPVVTVGGTNGKGSMVAMLEAVCRRAGYRTGAYTSPHILRYNERIRIDGREIEDADLIAAFEAVEQARRDTPLTYFEFGTLAALRCFEQAGVDLMLLEVGLGGRLDAVNLVDADCALIGQIALDHTDWLGPDRESIGREKAGIFRPGRPAVCADPAPPESIRQAAANLGVPLAVAGEDYRFETTGEAAWCWSMGERRIEDLPLPGIPGRHQLGNAAAVVTACRLADCLEVPDAALRDGLREVRLPGRFEVVGRSPQIVLDVAHNPAAATALAARLAEAPVAGVTYAVFAALEDKAVEDMVRAMQGVVAHWHVAGLETEPRGLSLEALARRMPEGVEFTGRESVGEALGAAVSEAGEGDRIVVFGSFHTVAAARKALPAILDARS